MLCKRKECEIRNMKNYFSKKYKVDQRLVKVNNELIEIKSKFKCFPNFKSGSLFLLILNLIFL